MQQSLGGKIVLGLVVVVAVVLYAFFRNIEVQPDKDLKPGPVEPARTPYEQFRAKWNGNERADWKVAEHLARLSLASYGDLDEVWKAAAALGIDEEVRRFEKRSMIGYVVRKGDVMLLAFRGTDDIEDWVINIDCFSPEPTDDGGVHRGFNRAYKSMSEEIRALVRDKRPAFVWITGHSLGGAMGTVCAYDLHSIDGNHPTGLMTFGQPMVATLDMANSLHRKLNGRFVHFANREDPVPRLPCFAYRHFGSLAMFTDDDVKRRWDVYQNRPGEVSGDSASERADLPPLSPDQVKVLKERIIKEKERRVVGAADGRVGWTVPALSAHGMQLYLDNVADRITNRRSGPIRQPMGAVPPAETGPVPRGK